MAYSTKALRVRSPTLMLTTAAGTTPSASAVRAITSAWTALRPMMRSKWLLVGLVPKTLTARRGPSVMPPSPQASSRAKAGVGIRRRCYGALLGAPARQCPVAHALRQTHH